MNHCPGGTVGTGKGESEHTGTVGREELWEQRNSGHRETEGTIGTEEQWVQRNGGHRETGGTEGQ